MAEVFVGASVGAEGFAKRVAIKRVLPGYSDNASFARMFIAEAKISSRLQHPNIVSVLDFDRDGENRLYLVMELVEGKDLDALASSGSLSIPVIIFIASEVLRGLGHAHDLPVVDDDAMARADTLRNIKGVVHRDVSPHNVLLSWEGAVKVSDFGIAKARTETSATASELIKGKPAYMSPEQANGEQLDGRSDLFAVGIMLWEMLCGRRLFLGDDTRALLAAVLFRDIPRPRSVRSDVPKDLDRVVMKLLERAVGSRYATAEVAIADLLRCGAAPRDGREQLKRAMAERFPELAPVRHSVLRNRSIDSAPNLASGVQSSPTVPGGGAAQRRATPESPTAAVDHETRAHSRWLLIAGASLIMAIVVFALVMSARGPHAKADETDAAARSARSPQPTNASLGRTTMLDAASAPATIATAPIDAGVVDAALRVVRKDAAGAQPAHVAAVKRGVLEINAFPALTVYIDNQKRHDTPFDAALPIGKHVVRLINRDIGHDETLTVMINENETTTLNRD